MIKIKRFANHMLLILITLFGASSIWAASAVEYGLATALLAAAIPGEKASQHSDCNKLTINKSPINNKSLNPLCQQCISQQDEGINSQYLSISIPRAFPDSGIEGSLSACVSTVSTQVFSAGYKSDAELMCSTRGGIFDSSSVVPVSFCYMVTNAPSE